MNNEINGRDRETGQGIDTTLMLKAVRGAAEKHFKNEDETKQFLGLIEKEYKALTGQLDF